MSPHTRTDDGFGLIEAIIAMTLLAILALALAPVLWDGLRYSSEQGSVATATRALNSLVEQARHAGDCSGISGAAASKTITNGLGQSITTSGTSSICAPGTAVRLQLQAVQGGDVLARADALITVPPLPESTP